MVTVTFEIPEEVVAALPCTPEEAARAIRLAAAFHWCRRGELSTGWAAQLAGLTYAGFLEAAARHQADLYDYDLEDVKQEIAHPLPEGIDVETIKQYLARAQAARR